MHIYPNTQPIAVEFNDSSILIDEEFDTFDVRAPREPDLHPDETDWDDIAA